MEAVPRLPMLSFELKTSVENPSFGPKLKQYIRDFYNEDGESYSNEIHQLEGLRAQAAVAQRSVSGCAALKRYFCQLHFLQSRFPMGRDGAAAVAFSWRHVYSGAAVSGEDARLELAAVLHNIGALHSQLGASDSRASPDGMKMCCTHFQCAAWAFQHLRESFPQPPGSDMAANVVSFMERLCLAQAQECILEKSMMDSRKPTIVAKVAVQVVEYYNQALAALDQGGSDEGSVADIIGSKLHKSWGRYIRLKAGYLGSLALLYHGLQAEEQQKMGERVAFYQAAADKLKDTLKLAKGMDQIETVNEGLAFTQDVVEGKRKAARNENEFIYHEEVPDRAALQEVKGASLVKGIPFAVNDPEIAGADLFARLVPMQAHQAASLYSEEMAKLRRRVGLMVDEKDRELANFVSALQLDQLELHSQSDALPQELVDRCAALNARPGAAQALTDAMTRLADSFNAVEDMLRLAEELLQREQAEEATHRERVGGARPPSIAATDLAREAAKYRAAHDRAAESNATLRKALTAHLPNLQILSGPLDELYISIPTLKVLTSSGDESSIAEMRRLTAKVREMTAQRAGLADTLRAATARDDITATLVTRADDEPLDALFQREMQKHHRVVSTLEQNLAAQANVLAALTEANARYADTRRAAVELHRARESTIAGLIAAYDAYEDLLSKSGKGLEFYRKLETNVSKLLQRVKGTCRVQDEERAQLQASVSRKASASVPSAQPKLKDYLGDTGGATPRLKDYLTKPAYAGPAPLPLGREAGEAVHQWPPSVRPAPVGQEGSEQACSGSLPPSLSYGYDHSKAMPTHQSYAYDPSKATPTHQSYAYDPSKATPTHQSYAYDPSKATPTHQSYAYDPSKATPTHQSYAYAKTTQLPGYSVRNPAQADQPPSYASQFGYGSESSSPAPGYQSADCAVQAPSPGYGAGQASYGGYNAQGSYSAAGQSNASAYSVPGTPSAYSVQGNAGGYSLAQESSVAYAAQGSAGAYSTQADVGGYSAQAGAGGYQPQSSAPLSYPTQNAPENYPAPGNYSTQAASNYPNQAAAANYPAQSFPTNYPTQTNTTNYPTQTNTTNYPTQISSTNFPTQSTPHNYPTQLNTANYPTQPNTANYPTQTNTANYSTQTNTANYPTQTNATNYPVQATPASYAAAQAGSNFPTFNPTGYQSDVAASLSTMSLSSNQAAAYTSAGGIAMQTSWSADAGAEQLAQYPAQGGYTAPYSAPSGLVHGQTSTYSVQTDSCPAQAGTYAARNDVYSGQAGQPYSAQAGAYASQQGSQPQVGGQATGYPGQATAYGQAGSGPSTGTSQGGGYSSETGAYAGQSGSGAYNGQSDAYSSQTGTYFGQSGAYTGQTGANTEAGAYIVQNGTYSGQNGAYSGQIGAYSGQTSAYGSQPTTSTYNSASTTTVAGGVAPSSSVDLLAGLDFTLGHAPLTPSSKPPKTADGGAAKPAELGKESASKEPPAKAENAEQAAKGNSSIVPSPKKTAGAKDEAIAAEGPEEKSDGKEGHASKDPYSDPEALQQLVAEVEKLDKFVEGLTVRTLNGPTPLDLKWKELQDLQEREGQKRSISVARCYPTKNRCPDILPYDDSRVELPDTKDDYINASHVRGLTNEALAFIATQMPLPSTLSDFWTMVWQQQAELVVCLLSDAELPGAAYWPEERARALEAGEMRVALQSRDVRAHWTRRIVSLECARGNRVVVLLQFTAWPGSSFPASPAPVLGLVKEALWLHAQQRSSAHPVVVHCLAGVGRTGLFCLLAAAVATVQQGRGVPCPVALAARMSCARRQAIRDREHLRFAYQALLYHGQDLLLKRGILSGKPTTFEGKRTRHARHPSDDFLLAAPDAQASADAADQGSAPESSEQPALANGAATPTHSSRPAAATATEDHQDPLDSLDPYWQMK